MYESQNKWCFVPGCKNTSKSAPNKTFISVPQNYSRKVKWFKAARRDVPKSKSTFFCCEDHFNLQEDMENFVRYNLIGGKVILKHDVIPHIFDCQQDRKRAASAPQRTVVLKRQRKQLVEEAIVWDMREKNVEQECLPTVMDFDEPSTSSGQARLEVDDYIVENTIEIGKSKNEAKSVGTQVKPYVRSKYVLCKIKPDVRHATSSPEKFFVTKDVSTSPFKNVRSVKKAIFSGSRTSSEIEGTESSTSVFTATSDTDITEATLLIDKKDEQKQALHVTRTMIARKPKSYIGVPDKWFPHFIDLLCSKTNLNYDSVLLTLMKIKLNDSLSRLGDSFGMSYSNCSKIFKKSLVQIEHFLQTLIYWPEKSKIRRLLPIAFRARYSSVQSIIDCLEIQIEKPSDPVKQALTWSEYKKCNTLKYLISSTPDGFISFISKGYGGRISDSLLVEESGYLQILPAGCSVMADRGFKDIGKLLHERNCHLIRPPSVSSAEKPTKLEVLETKRIASLRIHIERVIRRIREFQYLKPHSVIDHSFVAHTDSVIVIACALINLQTSIIK